MKSLDLFTKPPRARNDDPQTAKDAAEAFDAQPMQYVVLACLYRHSSGMTTREIAWEGGEDWGSITPRMTPLETAGMIERTGDKRQAQIPGKKLRCAIVWRITQRGIDALNNERK